MTNYGRVNYGGLFVRPLSTYVVSATHTHRKERCTNRHTHPHTHRDTDAHAQVGHTHVAFVCCQKGNKNIFAADLILLYFAIFICFFFPSVHEYVCVCVCVWKERWDQGGYWFVCVCLAHSALLALPRQKPLLYVSSRLPAAYPRRLNSESCPSGRRRMLARLLPLAAAVDCCR